MKKVVDALMAGQNRRVSSAPPNLIIDGERFVALGASMGKALSALATVATIGAAAAIESDFWPSDRVGSAESARSLIDGMILGSNVSHINAMQPWKVARDGSVHDAMFS